MTFEPLLNAPPMIQIHVAGALLSLLVGPFALFRRSRDIWHRRLGYLWVVAMAVTALSSFWINSMQVIGPFGPVHILSGFVLWSLYEGIGQARKGQIAAHQATMQGLYVYAICITGLFTLTPGRRMGEVVFGGGAGWLAMVGLACLGALIIYVHRKGVLPLGKQQGLF